MKRRTFLALASSAVAGAGCVSDTPATSPSDTAPPVTAVETTQRSRATGAEVAWARRYETRGGTNTSTPGGTGIFPVSVAGAPDGGFALGGSRRTRDGADIALLRTDSKGRSQWVEGYGGDRRDETERVIGTADGGYLLLGTNGRRDASNVEPPSSTPAPTRKRAWAQKVAADGTPQWDVRPVEDRRAVLTDGVQLPDGSYALAGWTDHDTGRAGLFARIDPDGGLATRETYNSEETGPTRTMPASGEPQYQDVFTSVCPGVDGGLVFGGENNRGGWIVHTDEAGAIRWQLDPEYPHDVVGDVARAAAGYVATGRLYERDDNDHAVTDTRNPSDLYLMRIDESGRRQWSKAYDGGRNEAGGRVLQTADGGFVAAGGSFTHRNEDVFLVKTTAAGDLQWSERFEFSSTGGGSADEPWEIPSYGHDLVEVADGEYAVAAGRVFLKVVSTEPTPTAAETTQPTDSATATGTATEAPDASETGTAMPTGTVHTPTADGS